MNKWTLRIAIGWWWGVIGLCLLLFIHTNLTAAEDWPTYRHDNARSGVTADPLRFPLVKRWEFSTTNPPLRAWPGPARQDGWHKVENLKPRVIFDWAYHVTIAGQRVYFGSSSDDKVYCLDLATGKELWSQFTDGPVRFSPTIHHDSVYVGSDDGYLYCFQADTGDLKWRYKAVAEDYRLPGNGRIMSLWPIRSGVLVDNQTAYFSAGIFPWENVFLCAVNSEDGSELWKQPLTNLAPQGYMLASATRLYLPTGRGTPAVFSRGQGELIHTLGGSGGTFALLSGDMLVYGPGKTGQLDAFQSDTNDQLATFNGNTMIITPTRSFLHTDTDLSALDRARHTVLIKEQRQLSQQHDKLTKFLKSLGKELDSDDAMRAQKELEGIRGQLARVSQELAGCLLWKVECRFPYSLILAGNTLVAGGTNEVAAFDSETGRQLWIDRVEGRALELAAANGSLIVSTDSGTITCYANETE